MAWKFQIGFTLHFLSWLFICSEKAIGEAAPIITLLQQRIELADYLLVFEDHEGRLTAATALHQSFESIPKNHRLISKNQGYFWILTPRLRNASDDLQRLFMKVNFNSDFYLNAFLIDDDDEIIRQLTWMLLRHPSMEIVFEPLKTYQILFQVKSHSFFWFHPTLMSQEQLWIEDRNESGLLIYCIGTILSALVFNLAMFISMRDLDRGWFLIFTSVCLFIMMLGYNIPHGIQSFSGINFQEYQVFLRAVVSALSVMFMRYFLQSNLTMPRFDRLAKIWIIFLIFLAIQNFSHPDITAFLEKYLIHPSSFMTMMLNIGLICQAIHLGYKPAIMMLFSWLFLIIGGSAIVIADTGAIPTTIFVLVMPIIGLTIETILTSVALSFKFRDLKGIKQLANRKKEEAQKLKFFLRIICHDLANPLSVITLASSILSKKYPEDTLMKKLTKSTKTMNEIVDYVRQSEIEQEHGDEQKPGPVELSQIIEEVLLIFDDRIRIKNLQICLDINPGVYVYARETSLKMQIFANLLSNAIKFTPELGTISVTARREQNEVIVEIADSGEGIPMELTKQLMEQKSRLASTLGTHGEAGSGFGLSLAYQATRQCGGKMLIENNPSGQSTSPNSKKEASNVGTKIILILVAASSTQYQPSCYATIK